LDFEDGIALYTILNFYEPDLVDFDTCCDNSADDNIDLCYSVLEEIEFNIKTCPLSDFGIDQTKTYEFLVDLFHFFELRDK